ncbi:MAG: MOSC domain-containing protein [bacterium]|nr:MOSC domain-containing protein [bacterium]
MGELETRGRIFQINVSLGGVPKLAVASAGVTVDGLTGDKQKNLKFHGGSKRAVCVYSLERILALQEEGHGIFPGATGENVTVSGVNWDVVVPGLRLKLGKEVLLEVLSYTEPCAAIRSYFQDGTINRILQDENPGWSRVYARVVKTGDIRVGDDVEILAS